MKRVSLSKPGVKWCRVRQSLVAEGDYDKGKCFGVHSERLKIHP